MSGAERNIFAVDEGEALAEAFMKGQGGNSQDMIFNLGVGGTPGLPICQVDVPRAQSRTWIVTLAQMKAANTGGTPAQVAGLSPPTENTVLNAFTEPSGNFSTGLANPTALKARVQFGTGEMREDVLIDYPWGGCSFQVSGSTVKVDIPPTLPLAFAGNFKTPRVGGFITARENGSVSPGVRPPTYTTPLASINSGITQVFWMPKRAIAWRPLIQAAAGPNVSWFQMSYNFGVTYESHPYKDPTVNTAGDPIPPFWTPTHPQATAIVVQNTNVGALGVYIQFQLDLG